MIDVADSNAVYYYHFDGLGSVVALSDSNGGSVQTYEYSAYGQVAAEDPNHPNPYMFTGRRFDFETGLYYYRARYYNPYIGRFLQTDPVGYYGDDMNLYAYCRNNPASMVDPWGNIPFIHWMAFRGGMWANRLPKPAYPGTTWTSWIDFFGWYAHGQGETVDLRKVGLIGDFRADERVAAWEKGLRDHADEMGKILAGRILSIGRDKATITIPYSKEFDFGGSLERVIYQVVTGLTAPPLSDPLVVLGNCTVKATMTITAWEDPDQPGKAHWSRKIEYSMKDSFKDPGDIMDRYPEEVEWWECDPYDIVANWKSLNGGSVFGSGPAP